MAFVWFRSTSVEMLIVILSFTLGASDMRAPVLPILVAASTLLLADVRPAYAQEDYREGRGSGRTRSGEYERREDDGRVEGRRGRGEHRRGGRGVLGDILRPRSLDIPAGHYPPPGECRVWYPDRPAGHQPPPTSCHRLRGRALNGGFILYGDRAYDADYDWERDERRRPGSIPDAILDIIFSRK